jgi:hypothetical protein
MRISKELELANRERVMTYVSLVCDRQICEQCPDIHKDGNETGGRQAYSGMQHTTHHNPSNASIEFYQYYVHTFMKPRC